MTIEVRITNKEDAGGRSLTVRERTDGTTLRPIPHHGPKTVIPPGESRTFHVHAAKALIVGEVPE